MRLDLTEEQEFVRDQARRWMEKEAPLSSVRAAYDDMNVDRERWRKLAELGWLGLGADESVGGYTLSGKAGQDLAIVAEEMGRLISAGPFAATCAAISALGKSPAHAELAQSVIAGESLVAWAFGERVNIWSPEGFTTRLAGAAGSQTLNGAKAYVEAGADAEHFLVTARGESGVTQVLVPRDAKGVSVQPGRSLDFVRKFATVTFEGVPLPADAVVGDPAADAQVERQLQLLLLLQNAESIGAVEKAYEFTIEYMRDRYAFGRPIASFQALKHRLADMLVWINSAMATNDAAVEAYDAESPDAGRLARIAASYVGRKTTEIVHDLGQMTGGLSQTWEHDIHIYERRIALNRALFGTPEDHNATLFRTLAAA
ncbi:MAG: acyl-CoA dehydrogenase family protein [Phenylobacterium sp.]